MRVGWMLIYEHKANHRQTVIYEPHLVYGKVS